MAMASLSLPEVWAAAMQAAGLLWAHPLATLGLVLVFLVLAEGVMFIPRIGFLVKAVLASWLAAGAIGAYALAASGQGLQVGVVFSVFTLPAGALWPLALGGLLPFLVGVAWLHWRAGPAASGFFFSRLSKKSRPPQRALFSRFKWLMHAVGMPFTFLPAVVVMKGMAGAKALVAALAAAWANLPALALLLVLGLALELAMGALAGVQPKWVGGVATGALLLAFVAGSLAFTATLSARVLAPVPIAQGAP